MAGGKRLHACGDGGDRRLLEAGISQPRLLLEGSRAQAAVAGSYGQLSLFGEVFERVRAEYVEKPDPSKLIELAINGMLAGLDPHLGYMDAKGLRDLQVQTRGEFGGLGIEVTMEQGLIKVVAPIDETPAAKAGIMANDIITHLNEEPVQGLTLDQAVDKMRGRVNTKIKLKIVRNGQDKPIEVVITRDIIHVRPVRSHLEGTDIGFMRSRKTCRRNSRRAWIQRARPRCAGISRRKEPSRQVRSPISPQIRWTTRHSTLRSISFVGCRRTLPTRPPRKRRCGTNPKLRGFASGSPIDIVQREPRRSALARGAARRYVDANRLQRGQFIQHDRAARMGPASSAAKP